jgi:hypothetical protein
MQRMLKFQHYNKFASNVVNIKTCSRIQLIISYYKKHDPVDFKITLPIHKISVVILYIASNLSINQTYVIGAAQELKT